MRCTDTFSVLFVCTGNICRSAIAERVFAARVRTGADVVVASAGTSALAGCAVDGSSAELLRTLGVDPDGHAARQVGDAMLTNADLVLTATASHRSALLVNEPARLPRVFTLREFARIAPKVSGSLVAPTAAELRRRVADVARSRGSTGPAGPGDNDIRDPFGASSRVTRQTFTTIVELVDTVLAALSLDAR